jgi:penicillin-binding protein 1C
MAEAALLTSMPQAPSRLRPDRDAQRAQAARDKVLARMQVEGVWSAANVADARLERVFAPPMRAQWIAPLAAERLRRQVRRDRAGSTGDVVIRSSLDAGIQLRLEQVLLDRLGTLPEQVSIAALIVENDNLFVRGYAGSADFTDAQRAAHVDMVRGVRSPGSTLKPFLYALALDEGLIHSESLLIDAPQSFGGYAPGNFQASFSGPVSASEALQRSLNVPAVDLLDRVGPERFTAHLRNAGLRLRMQGGAAPNLSAILGGAGTTLEELVGAYTALARKGVAGVPRLTQDAALQETRLMSAGAAFIVREILENGGRPDTPFRESSTRIAWKTGTSFGFRDAWAVAVTDRYTLGIWVGRPDGTPNPGYFGANTAAPLAKDLLAAIGDQPGKPRRAPANVKAVEICWPLGLAANLTPASQCRARRNAWTLGGTAPPTLPDRLRTGGAVEYAWIDPVHQQRVRPDCASADPSRLQRIEFTRWPTLLGPWIEPAMRDEAERWPWAPGCVMKEPAHGLHITGLDAGVVLRLPPGARAALFQVQVVGSEGPFIWLLDGKVLEGSAPASGTRHVTLDSPGEHVIVAMDAQGRFDRIPFSMR